MKQKTQSSRSLKRLVMALACRVGWHRWEEFEGVTADTINLPSHRHMWLMGRVCKSCGIEHTLMMGPFGSGDYEPANPWPGMDWEKEWWDALPARKLALAKCHNEVDEWTAIMPGEVEREKERKVRK